MKKLFNLFFIMLKIGLFTFGGGYAMIALLENEFVSKRRWMQTEEFSDMVAIAESTPGPIAINAATYIGYQQNGVLGSTAATIGVCIPSFAIIFLISLFFDAFQQIRWVAAAFKGIQIGVVVLILSAGLKMLRQMRKTIYNIVCVGLTTACLVLCSLFANFQYDWRSVPDMDQLGFPIAELTENDFHITKAPDCGGLISEQSVKEQFLYEVHDPANYITPDVTVDISHATLTQDGKDRVRVGGIKGKARPDQLKLCLGYHAGYKVVTYLSFAWPDAYEKAQYAAEILMKKMKRKGMQYEDLRIDYLGLNALHLDVAEIDDDLIKRMNEVVLRIAIRTKEKKDAQLIIPEISPLQLNGPPGASFFGGRAHVTDVIGLWPTLIPRDAVKLESHILEVK